jgi:RNA polymerase sigma-70 factor, ECF subfamily
MDGAMLTENHLDIPRLLTKARAGGSECLGRLLQYYGNYLKLLASTQIDEKLRARCSPSDIVQETYCEAHRDFAKFRGATAEEFLAWLRAILVNNLGREVERHILTAKRDIRREISLAAVGESLERSAARLESILADQRPSPSSQIHRQERTVLLANHLAELSADYRQVLILRHCEGLPFKEIAARMQRSEGAARMLWLRAIGEIRERLGGGEIP